SNVIEWWMETLLEEKPAAISIHGRTLKQMYQGKADWEAIAKAAKIIHQTETLVLGNGDIASLEEAHRRIEETGVDGVLIGRHAIGNPWVFNNHKPTREERIATAREHTAYYVQKRGETRLASLGKHLAGYLSHFPDAALLRSKILGAKNGSYQKSLSIL
ncbi:MAG: tRNA-dihydrouridine synthase, partial [bacterium]|nr:tRNA-dihydrouridine synthase [bacterium]